MTQVFEYYNTFFSSLKQMEAELSSAYKQLSDAQSEYSNAVSMATQNLHETLETIEKDTSKVNAFIGIAKTHTSQLKEASEPQVYDSGLLSRLSVQIILAWQMILLRHNYILLLRVKCCTLTTRKLLL